MQSTSICGRLIGIPAASPANRTCGIWSSTRPMSAVVPPMSKVSASCSPTSEASRAPPITPAAGPEAARPIGSCRARSAAATPPLVCIKYSGTGTPSSATSALTAPR